jgi:hypothetical protein
MNPEIKKMFLSKRLNESISFKGDTKSNAKK